MPIITLTRGRYSGGEEVAKQVAKVLDAACLSSEVLAEAASQHHIEAKKMEGVLDKTPNFWERMTESRRVQLSYVRAKLVDYASSDNLVYHGNAGQELLREAPHTLKVRLVYPRAYRVSSIIKQFKHSQEKAERMVDAIDEERTEQMRYLFNADWRDVSRYDLVIRMEHIHQDYAVKLILDLVKQPAFQLSKDKRPAFDDFCIKNRVYALLATSMVGRLSLIEVNVKKGIVTLRGAITADDSMIGKLEKEIRTLNGVKGIKNDIATGLVYQEWSI